MGTVVIQQSKLFFIIAKARYGSSILQQVMDTFQGFSSKGEARYDGPGSVKCYSFIRKNNDFTHLEDFIAENWTSEYFVEKTPGNYNFVEELAARYSDAKFIFLQRHPLKVVISTLNHVDRIGEDYRMEKRRRHNAKVLDEVSMSHEEWIAWKVLKAVKKTNDGKHFCKFQITVRYEDLVSNLEKTVNFIADSFQIKSNLELARERLATPAKGSAKNTYNITHLTDPKAIEYVKKACRIWGYDYENA